MEITANAVQNVPANRNIIFTDTAVPGNCSILHREGSGLVTLRGLTQQCRARFRVTFGCNLALGNDESAATVSLAIAVNGEPVGPTTMTITPDADDEYFNVFSSIFLDVPRGCCIQVSVENISTAVSVDVQNANLIVERVA